MLILNISTKSSYLWEYNFKLSTTQKFIIDGWCSTEFVNWVYLAFQVKVLVS